MLDVENDVLEFIVEERGLAELQDGQCHAEHKFEAATREHTIPQSIQQRVAAREGGESKTRHKPLRKEVGMNVLTSEVSEKLGKIKLEQKLKLVLF